MGYIPFLCTSLLLFLTFAMAAKDESIAIVGAGYSGLSAAYHLVQAGHTNIQIFEKTGRVGGFVETLEYKSVNHELSVYGVTSIYWRFIAAMEDLNVSFCKFASNFADTTMSPPKAIPIEQILLKSQLERFGTPERLSRALNEQIVRYTALFSELFGSSFVNNSLLPERLFPTKPLNQTVLDLVSLPMEEFFARFDLELLKLSTVSVVEGQGYGVVSDLPALYYLTWIQPYFLQFRESFVPCGKYDSMSAVVNLLANYLTDKGVQIHLNSGISRVQRMGSFARVTETASGARMDFDHVIMTGFARVTETASGARMDFDHVIMTGRMRSRGGRGTIVAPVLSEEAAVADTITGVQIFTGLLETQRTESFTTKGFLTLDYDAVVDPTVEKRFWGALAAEHRDSGNENPFNDTSTTTRLAGLFFYREQNDGVRVSLSTAEKVAEVTAGLGKWDNATWKLVRSAMFDDYFQRWRPNGVAKGLPWAIADIQGRGRVYYVGSAACGFESIGTVFDCAKHLVDEHF